MTTVQKLDTLFASSLEGRAAGELAQALWGDPGLRAAYRRRVLLEAALCQSDPDELTPFSLDRVERLVMARTVRAPRRWLVPFLLPSLATALGTAVLLLWMSPVDHRTSVDPDALLTPLEGQQLTARGVLTKPWNVGIRVFRVDAPGRVQDPRLDESLSLEDQITFSYSAVDEGLSYLTLIGLQPGAALIWYYPESPVEGSLPIETGVVDRPLGDGFVLRAQHGPGPLQIVALFGAAPLDRVSIEGLIGSSVPVASVAELLHLRNVQEHSLLFVLDEVSR